MRILVVGAGRTGAAVIQQLRKNESLTIITTDARENPYALANKIIDSIDYHEALTPFNLDYLVNEIQPDLVLLTRGAEDLGLGTAMGLDLFSDSLKEELAAIATVPVIQVTQIT